MTEIDRSAGAVERAAARGMVTGTIFGFVLVTGIFTTIMLSTGADLAPAIGVGLFAGFWGGPGFGGMMGAILGAIRAKDAIAALEAAAPDTDPTTSRVRPDPHDSVGHGAAA